MYSLSIATPMQETRTTVRNSSSLQPSATSSSTLHDRIARSFADSGEGSAHASQGSSLDGHNPFFSLGPRRQRLSEDISRAATGVQDSGRRRHRTRRSGGFLLDPTFPSPEQSWRHYRSRSSDMKGKSRTGHSRSRSGAPSSFADSHGIETIDGSSGWGDETVVSRTSVDVGDGAQSPVHEAGTLISNLRIPKNSRRQPASIPGVPFDESFSHPSTIPAQPALDPAQIVNMALALSQKRNVSAGQAVNTPGYSGRRAASAGIMRTAPQLHGSYQDYGPGGSLRQHIQQQRRVSRNMSPNTGRPRNISSPKPNLYSEPAVAIPQTLEHKLPISPATEARAERAKLYIELNYQYRRLLHFLPPLKSDFYTPGYTIISTTSIPGSATVDISRVPSQTNRRQDLGRAYNPLQYIRNRKLRARERKTLNPTPDDFNNLKKVERWVNEVARCSTSPEYRDGERVILPAFTSTPSPQDSVHSGVNMGHRKADSALIKPGRPRRDWYTCPAEFLADAVWLEQDENKTLIEDGYGTRIFQNKRSSVISQPRSSKELPRDFDKRRKSAVESISKSSAPDSQTGEESDDASFRGRRLRHLLPGRREDSAGGAKRPPWVSRTRSRSSSGSSSEDEYRWRKKRRSERRHRSNEDENIGPLDLQILRRLNDEAKKREALDDNLISPQDKWGSGHVALSGESVDPTKAPPQDIDISHIPGLDPRQAKEPRLSYDDLDFTAPNTPLKPHMTVHIGTEPSPPPSRKASPTRKSMRAKLGLLRPEGGSRSRNTESHDFAAEDSDYKSSHSRQASGEKAPGPVKQFFTHRKNESITSLSGRSHSRSRKESRDIKEPGSAVSRFFKGGRVAEIVRNEGVKVGDFIFKRDPPPEDAESSGSGGELESSTTDDEVLPGAPKQRSKGNSRTNTLDSTGCQTPASTSGYHFELPTFKSTSELLDNDRSPAILTDDPIYQQQLLQKQLARSPNLGRLKPLAIPSRPTLSSGEAMHRHNSSQIPFSLPRSAPNANRLAAALELTGTVCRGGLPVTGLSDLDPQPNIRVTRPHNKRHWSITDRDARRPSINRVFMPSTELARIRALLLCSGIKAREIARRAHSPRSEPPFFLRSAAEASGSCLYTVLRTEEHVLAARLLSTAFENSTSALVDSADKFRDSTTPALRSRIAELRSYVANTLTPRVHGIADDADALTRELSGEAPLAVKSVLDRIEEMSRVRRRRMRWVRRAGWVLLEWTVVGIMYWVWFMVVLVRFARAIAMGMWKGIRWLIWV